MTEKHKRTQGFSGIIYNTRRSPLAARVSRSWKVEPSVKLGDLRDKVKHMRTYMKN